MKNLCFPGTFPPVPLSRSTAIVSAFLIVFITTGNSLILIAIIKDPRKQLRSPFAYFLANLAFSDFMVGVIAMPVSVMFHVMESKREINTASIYVVHITFFLSLAASLFSMAAMCFDRYVTITSLSTEKRRFTRNRCIKASLAIWLLSIVFTSSYYFTGYIMLVTIYLNVSFICIFGITLLTYVKILRSLTAISKVINLGHDNINRQLNKGQRSMKNAHCTQQRKTTLEGNKNKQDRQHRHGTRHGQRYRYKQGRRIATEQRITRVFLVMLGTFLSSNLPAVVFTYVLQFCLSCDCSLRHVFRDIVFILLPTASGLNALICILKMPNVRQAVKEIMQFNRKNIYKFSDNYISENSRDPSPKERYIERNSCKAVEGQIWICKRSQIECGQHDGASQNFQCCSNEYKSKLQQPIYTVNKVQDNKDLAEENIRHSEGEKKNIRKKSNSFPGSYMTVKDNQKIARVSLPFQKTNRLSRISQRKINKFDIM